MAAICEKSISIIYSSYSVHLQDVSREAADDEFPPLRGISYQLYIVRARRNSIERRGLRKEPVIQAVMFEVSFANNSKSHSAVYATETGAAQCQRGHNRRCISCERHDALSSLQR